MGDESDGDQPLIYFANTPMSELAHLTLEPLCDAVAAHYELRDPVALDELAHTLIGYACRDQFNNPMPGEAVDRRRLGRGLARRIKTDASNMIQLARSLQKSAQEFQKVVHWSPALLEEIFQLELPEPGGLEGLFLPAELVCIDGVVERAGAWTLLERSLQPLASLPVRTGKSGTPANITLRHAVRSCRRYWCDVEKLPWGMYRLSEATVRRKNDRADLVGRAEQFVANMLTICGVGFNLQGLNSAWKAVDDEEISLG